MPMTDQNLPTWWEFRARIEDFDRDRLLKLLRDLYLFSKDNRVLLVSQCEGITPEALATPYRQIIQRELNPEQGLPCASVRVARAALDKFIRASRSDPNAVADMLLYYVEQGVAWTLKNGPYKASYYSSLGSVYQEVVYFIPHHGDAAMVERFRPRFQALLASASAIDQNWYGYMLKEFSERYPPVSQPEAG